MFAVSIQHNGPPAYSDPNLQRAQHRRLLHLRVQLIGAEEVRELGLAVHGRVPGYRHVLGAAAHALSPLSGLDDLLLHVVW